MADLTGADSIFGREREERERGREGEGEGEEGLRCGSGGREDCRESKRQDEARDGIEEQQ